MFSAFLLLISAFATLVLAERHTISFVNKCGYGTPLLVQSGQIFSHGEPYTFSGPFPHAITYLQTKDKGKECTIDGVGCTLVELTIQNPGPAPGSGSSADISLIKPHEFNVPVGFAYKDTPCHGYGARCAESTCATAFFQPDETQKQVACQEIDHNIEITFCPSGSTKFLKWEMDPSGHWVWNGYN